MTISKRDYIRLEQAVRDFNKEVTKLEKLGDTLTPPEKLNIYDLKEKIITKANLDSTITNLEKFNANSVDAVTLPNGSIISKWEYDLLKESQTRGLKEVQALKESYEIKEPSSKFTRAEMGSTTYNNIKRQLSNLETAFDSGTLSKLRERLGVFDADRDLRQARLFKENYLEVLQKYQGFDGYEELRKKLESIRNPNIFYKFVSKNELTKDLTYQSDQTYGQEAFNNFITLFGITPGNIESGEVNQFYEQEMIYRSIDESIEGVNFVDEDLDDLPF